MIAGNVGAALGQDAWEGAQPEPPWRPALLAKAQELAASVPDLQGRRRYTGDTRGHHYTFEGFVRFADECGFGGPTVEGALLVAQEMWRNSVPDSVGGRRRHKDNPHEVYYSFEEWLTYVDQMGWGGLSEGGLLQVSMLLWNKECLPKEEDDLTMVNDDMGVV